MAWSINPSKVPPLPSNAIGWARSLRRGSTYHAHDVFGNTVCRRMKFERHKVHERPQLHDMQYWGVCPDCMRASRRDNRSGS